LEEKLTRRASPTDAKSRRSLVTEDTNRYVIEFRNVAKEFERNGSRTKVIDELSMAVAFGEFACIVGKSGCGKSTLLNMAAGIQIPTQGAVLCTGRRLDGVNTSIGYVTQSNNLLRWRTVMRNIALPLEMRHFDRREIRERTAEVLSRVGLSGFGDYYPHEISGGMRKRVILARALVWNPSALLLDEPFASLDAQTRLSLQERLLGLCAESGMTVLLVTHDLMEALALGDRVIALSRGPARVIGEMEAPGFDGDLRSAWFGSEYRESYERLWEMLADGGE
jgi:NitT/TauT family transport system ATP-binding protein